MIATVFEYTFWWILSFSSLFSSFSHSLNVPLHHICGHWSRLSQSEVCCTQYRAIWRHAYCVSNWRGRRRDSLSETLCRSETKTVSSIAFIGFARAFSCELSKKGNALTIGILSLNRQKMMPQVSRNGTHTHTQFVMTMSLCLKFKLDVNEFRAELVVYVRLPFKFEL